MEDLRKSMRYKDVIMKVDVALEHESLKTDNTIVLEDEPEYQLIIDCNKLSVEIEDEITSIHTFIRDEYRSRLPELESLVHHPIDYAHVVKRIRNETDLTRVDLEEMVCIAPNLSAIIGTSVAGKLMATAGGLSSLAYITSCNVRLLGAKKTNLAGCSSAMFWFCEGYIEQTEIFDSTPPPLRIRACRILASKSVLAARIDSARGDPTGKRGRDLREEIRKKIDKGQEPQLPKLPKPLPVPVSEPKTKRGGRRLRKRKERYAVTEKRKLANRIQFGTCEESSLGDGLGEGYGMLGQAGSGKLRVSAGPSKLLVRVNKKLKGRNYGSSGATTGMATGLAFTPVQGIELSNPQACAHQLGSGIQSTYFSETGTFSKIKRI
ncbi:hypothetical protein V2J09_006135 [Rumex salicifolius]